MKATLTNYRQSPRKVRLLADLIKGKTVAQAEIELTFADKRAALPVLKLLKSAAANAENNFSLGLSGLVVKDVRVDKGIVLNRIMHRAMGRAFRINKRTSHITISVGTENTPPPRANRRAPQHTAATVATPASGDTATSDDAADKE